MSFTFSLAERKCYTVNGSVTLVFNKFRNTSISNKRISFFGNCHTINLPLVYVECILNFIERKVLRFFRHRHDHRWLLRNNPTLFASYKINYLQIVSLLFASFVFFAVSSIYVPRMCVCVCVRVCVCSACSFLLNICLIWRLLICH